MKCKKDKVHAKDQLCPVCASPQHLSGKQIFQPEAFQCTGPVISISPGKDISHEEHISELLSLEDFKSPFGNVTLNLTDEHGNTVDLTCQVVKPRESADISWNYTESSQISANMTVLFDLECPMDREKYASLWRLLAYYSEVALHLRREIMLSKEPELSYRYRQDIERDVYYYTGVRANILSRPSWLMQSYVNIQLNRPYSTSKTVKIIFTTLLSSTTDQARQQKKSWVMIKNTNTTQTTFSSVVGGMMEMDCSVVSSGGPSIQWMLPDGSKVRASFSSPNNRVSVSNTGKLLIKSVDHLDSGVYYCIAEVLGDVDLLPFRLSVAESSRPPTGEEVKVALEKFVGESVYLPCNTTASPDADVNWIFPDSSTMRAKANSSRGFIFSNGTLFIPHSRLDDNGNYKCVALNQHGEDTFSAKLSVMKRQETQPFRRYPMRPLSAAGVSTKVRTIFEDMEESSGDDIDQKRMPSSRGFMNQRRGPQSRSRAYPVRNMQRNVSGHRKPIKKGLNGQQRKDALGNRRKINTSNNRIDPQRWADLLAKIREGTVSSTTTPGSYSSIPVGRGQTVEPESHNIIEGSSPDDVSPLKEKPNSISTSQTHNPRLVTAPPHIKNQLHQIMPPELGIKSDETILKPAKTTAAPNHVTTEINILEENHVNALTTSASHREERHRNQLENNPAAANSEFKNELGISTKSADVKSEKDSVHWISTSTQTTKLISANAVKHRTLSSSYSRTPWNSRRRLGNRGRINRFRLRPSLPLITSRPQIFTAPKATEKHNPSITTTTSATLTAGTSAYYTAAYITSSQYLKSFTDNDRNGNDQTNVSLLADKINPLAHKLEVSELSTIQGTEPTLHVTPNGLHHAIHSTPPAVTLTTSQRRANKETSEESWKDVQTFTSAVKMSYHTASTSQPEAEHETLAVTREGFTTQLPALEPSQKSVTEDDTRDISLYISESHPEKSHSNSQILNFTNKSVKSAIAPVKALQTPVMIPNEETKAEELEKKTFSDSTVKQNQTGFLTTTFYTVPDEYDSVLPIITPGPEVGDGELLFYNISKSSGFLTMTSTMIPPTTKVKIQISTKPPTTTKTTSVLPSIKTTGSGFNTQITPSNFGETTTLKPRVLIPDNRIPFYSRNTPTNHIPDQDRERTLKYPNHRHSSVDIRANSVGTVRSSVSPKSFTTSTWATTTRPTSTAKPLSRIQTGVVFTNRHLGENVPLPQPPYVPVQRARPRITTANLTTVTVNAETDVQLPCNSMGDPKPFLTWTKTSTGKINTYQTFFILNNKYKQIHQLIFKLHN